MFVTFPVSKCGPYLNLASCEKMRKKIAQTSQKVSCLTQVPNNESLFCMSCVETLWRSRNCKHSPEKVNKEITAWEFFSAHLVV